MLTFITGTMAFAGFPESPEERYARKLTGSEYEREGHCDIKLTDRQARNLRAAFPLFRACFSALPPMREDADYWCVTPRSPEEALVGCSFGLENASKKFLEQLEAPLSRFDSRRSRFITINACRAVVGGSNAPAVCDRLIEATRQLHAETRGLYEVDAAFIGVMLTLGVGAVALAFRVLRDRRSGGDDDSSDDPPSPPPPPPPPVLDLGEPLKSARVDRTTGDRIKRIVESVGVLLVAGAAAIVGAKLMPARSPAAIVGAIHPRKQRARLQVY